MRSGKYTVNQVEERTQVPAATLRQWERRYGFPLPERTEAGYRLYSDADLDAIEEMKRHIASGVPASRAAELTSQAPRAPEQIRSVETLQRDLVEALISLDERQSETLLSEAYSLYPVETVVSELLHHAMVDIGQLWHDGEVTTTTEHFASNFVQGRLRVLMNLTGTSHGAAGVIVACAPHDMHELGALMLAVLLRRSGYRVYFTGANTPIEDLAAMAASVRPVAVMISASGPESMKILEGKKDLLNSLAPMLIFGGRAFNDDPSAAGRLGGLYLAPKASASVEGFERLMRDSRLKQP